MTSTSQGNPEEGNPGEVSNEQRRDASSLFYHFGKSAMPYTLCRYILDKSKNNYVKFQAASTICNSIIRDWKLLTQLEVMELRNFLIQYCLQNLNIESYIRESMLTSISMIVKCDTGSDGSKERRADMFDQLALIIKNGSLPEKYFACSLLKSLLEEYENGSSGHSVHFHVSSKNEFENEDLQKVFVYTCQLIEQFSDMQLTDEVVVVLCRVLYILQQILSWQFHQVIDTVSPSSKEDEFVVLRPPITWKPLLLDNNLLDVLFMIYQKFRVNVTISLPLRQCLLQMATLSGVVFESPDLLMTYLNSFVLHLVKTITSMEFLLDENIDFANIIKNLSYNFSLRNFRKLPLPTFENYLLIIGEVTAKFTKYASQQIYGNTEYQIYSESYQIMLEVWVDIFSSGRSLGTMDNDFKEGGLLYVQALVIFNSFIINKMIMDKPHLWEDNSIYNDDYEDDEDIVAFSSQLSIIGVIARVILKHSVPIISRLLREKSAGLLVALCTPTTNSEIISPLSEDAHWLIIIAGHVIMDSYTEYDETISLIPDEIQEFSSLANSYTNEASLKMYNSIVTHETVSDDNVDCVVGLITEVLKCTKFTAHVESSPQLQCSLMWFMKLFSKAYLFMSRHKYEKVPDVLSVLFEASTEAASWTARFFMEIVFQVILGWSGEKKVVDSVIELFSVMANNVTLASFICTLETCGQLVDGFTAPPDTGDYTVFNKLTSGQDRNLCNGLICLGFSQRLTTRSDHIWHKVVSSLLRRFQVAMSGNNLNQKIHEPQIKREVGRLLEALSGIVKKTFEEDEVNAATSNVNFAVELFDKLLPIIQECPKLLELYHSYQEIVTEIMEFYHYISSAMFTQISEMQKAQFVECVGKLVSVYANFNIGYRQDDDTIGNNQKGVASDYEDLILIFEILYDVINLEYYDGISYHVVKASKYTDMIFYSISVLTAFINHHVIRITDLLSPYLKLLVAIITTDGDKLCQLSPRIIDDILTIVKSTMNFGSIMILQYDFEFIEIFSSTVANTPALMNTHAHNECVDLLKTIFHLLIREKCDISIFETIGSRSLYNLICCHGNVYRLLASELVTTQTDPAIQKAVADALVELQGNEQESLPFISDRTPIDMKLSLNFAQRLDRFLHSVGGFICTK